MNEYVVIDLDDTIINFVPVWLELYESESGHKLDISDITDWDISRFVLPEWKKRIYEYVYDPSIYYACSPIVDSHKTIELLRNIGYKIVYCTVSMYDAKFDWLRSHDYYNGSDEYVVTTNKDLILPNSWIIDDNIKHLSNRGKNAILMTKPWNKIITGGEFHRIRSWLEVPNILYGEGYKFL